MAETAKTLLSPDDILTARIRRILSRRMGFSERRMFGGVCFLINGNMCTGSWKGALIVRLEREEHERTQAVPHVRPMDITGKVMRGWAMVEPAGIANDDDLKHWVRRAADFASTLPPK